LVPHLRARGIEIGDMGALIERRHLERGAGAGRRLLENEGNLFAFESLGLGPGVPGGLQRARKVEQKPELARLEVDLFDEAAVAKVETHVGLPVGLRTRGRVRVDTSCNASRRGRGRARNLRW